MTRDSRRTTKRRRVLAALGTAALAGCLGDDGGGSSDGGGGGSGTTGGATTTADPVGDTTAAEPTTTTGETEDTTADGSTTTRDPTTADETTATSSGGTPTPVDCDEVPDAGARRVGTDDRDWGAVAQQERKYPYELPDDAPAYFGFVRSCPGRLTMLFGGTEDATDVDAGTVYVLLLIDGSVEVVVEWETPLNGDGDRLPLDAETDLMPVEVNSISRIMVAWEYEGETEVVYDSEE